MRANLWYEWRVWSWQLEATLSSILRRKNEIMSVCRCKQFVIGIAINWGNHTWCFYIFLQNKLITESEKKVRKVRNLRCNRVVLSYLQTVVNLNTGGKWRLKAIICRAFWVRSICKWLSLLMWRVFHISQHSKTHWKNNSSLNHINLVRALNSNDNDFVFLPVFSGILYQDI